MGKNTSRETIFRFKRFQVKNELSAMKVGTDGVLLGAWADVAMSQCVLDAGSGTGLIALMTAQRSNAHIIGVEIDSTAARESVENVEMSPWRDRIEIVEGDITAMTKRFAVEGVDHVISNPPFFGNGVKATDRARAIARHCDSLSFDTLINFSSKILNNDGRLSFVSPYTECDNIITSAAFHNMHISRYAEVMSRLDSKLPVRILWELSMSESYETQKSVIVIRDLNNQYTQQYKNLTQDFYLNM